MVNFFINAQRSCRVRACSSSCATAEAMGHACASERGGVQSVERRAERVPARNRKKEPSASSKGGAGARAKVHREAVCRTRFVPALFGIDRLMVQIAAVLGEAVAADQRIPFTLNGSADGCMIACFILSGKRRRVRNALRCACARGQPLGAGPAQIDEYPVLERTKGGTRPRTAVACVCTTRSAGAGARGRQPDTLVLFRSDKVLHRVAPSHERWRFTFTLFLLGEYRDGEGYRNVGFERDRFFSFC